MKVTGTFDIECASWDRFAVAATYEPDRGVNIHRTPDALVDHLLSRAGSAWFSHCGGSYDSLLVAEVLRRRSIPCNVDLAGARVSRLVGGGITLRDSWPLVPLGLDIAAGLAGLSPPTLGLPCRCGTACGGFCSIRPSDPRRVVADYCAADARVLFGVLSAVREIASDLGLVLRGTLGGTAWSTARDMLDLPAADFPASVWHRIRRAYHGGRVTIGKPLAAGPGAHWDLSSAYPAALAKTRLPIGDFAIYGNKDSSLVWDNQRPGAYCVDVDVPHSHLPPLPVRVRERVCYPTGKFRGVWMRDELRAAVERGVTVDRVLWAMAWEDEEVIFEPLIKKWWSARKKAGKGSPLGQWLRLLSNSITGKLAEQPDRRTAKMFPAEIVRCPMTRPCTNFTCTGACGSMEQIDLWGEVWAVPFYRPSSSGHIHWAACLTASTRETWLRGAEQMGDELVYGDTDSLWVDGRTKPTPNGARLGEWAYKHAWTAFECTAPRTYRFIEGEATVPTVRAAGAQLSDAEWGAGQAARNRGVLSFIEAATKGGGLFQRNGKQWTLPTRGRETGWYGDRVLDTSRGITVPVTYAAIEKAARRVPQGGTHPGQTP